MNHEFMKAVNFATMFFYTIAFANKILFFITVTLFLYTSPAVFGQTQIDPDSAYRVARELAFSGRRAEARIILRKILAVNPASAEIQTLLGRTYSWDKKFDSARTELTGVLSYSPKNEDATNALADTELWSERYFAALMLSEKALKEINPRSEEFLLIKARALNNLKRYKEALTVTEQLLEINPKNEKAIALGQEIKKETRINKIGLSYDYDRFSSTFSPWTGFSAFYSRKTNLLGRVIGRINYANRFNVTGVQYEVDMYPRLTGKMYAYFNAGYSKDRIFPNYRFGFSLYRNLPKSFEAEIGMRYLKFSNSTYIYTGSVGKYIRNLWFSLRPTVVSNTGSFSRSVNLITKYYMKGDADNFLSLSLGTGVSPDQFSRDLILVKNPYVGSNSATLGFQHRILSRYLFSIGLGYRKDEFRKGLFRENYNFNTGLEIFF